MARKVKFALEMADGTKVRSNLEELREHFDMESIARYYLSGKLLEWRPATKLSISRQRYC